MAEAGRAETGEAHAGPGLPPLPCLLLAGGAFSLALFSNFGYHAGASFALLALGVAALAAGTVALQRRGTGTLRGATLSGAFVAWLAVAVALATSDEPWSMFVAYAPHVAQAEWTRALFLGGLLLVVVGIVRDTRWMSLARLVLFATAFLLGAHWTIGQSPEPGIDVWHMHQEAADRLLHLENPYGLRVPYFGQTIDFYAYPPVTLLVQTVAYAVVDDVRYASVAALLVAGAAARAMARRAGLPRFAADAAGALLVVQGRPFYMIEQGWTEPVVAGLVAVAAWAWAARNRWAAPLAALALASKQFLWLGVALLVRVPAFERRSLLVAGAVLAAVFLPFLAWGPQEFWHGVVASHFTGEAVNITYPGVEAGDPWPGSSTLAVHLQGHGIDWPLWVGTVLWLAAAAGFALARDRGLGTLLVSSAAAVACLSFFGVAFHPNYIWLMPTLVVLGVLADRARARSGLAGLADEVPGPASGAEGAVPAPAAASAGEGDAAVPVPGRRKA